ncbi:MAG TPA: response regulator [Vicinamibacterales bacterium]|nr:response regulator [Vicinamibacterales bacterium]
MSLQALRILIVDDHEDSAEMLSMLLCGKGHATRTALDGAAALAAAAAFQPHVGLLDLSLPGMSGYDLAPRLRALPGLTRIRLVAVTGHGSDAHRARARAAGFDEHLLKPVDLQVVDAVLESVRQALRQAR